LSRKKFALGIADLESISPSMSDRCPPVTRLMMLAIDPDALGRRRPAGACNGMPGKRRQR
jgi:hypothetical protein